MTKNNQKCQTLIQNKTTWNSSTLQFIFHFSNSKNITKEITNTIHNMNQKLHSKGLKCQF